MSAPPSSSGGTSSRPSENTATTSLQFGTQQRSASRSPTSPTSLSSCGAERHHAEGLLPPEEPGRPVPASGPSRGRARPDRPDASCPGGLACDRRGEDIESRPFVLVFKPIKPKKIQRIQTIQRESFGAPSHLLAGLRPIFKITVISPKIHHFFKITSKVQKMAVESLKNRPPIERRSTSQIEK